MSVGDLSPTLDSPQSLFLQLPQLCSVPWVHVGMRGRSITCFLLHRSGLKRRLERTKQLCGMTAKAKGGGGASVLVSQFVL